MQQPTIYDVARRAGVAASTVSRAFGVPGRVSEPTRRKIMAAAEELGYVPNPHAKALQSGTHRTLALVLSDITNPAFFRVILGAEQRAKAASYTLVIVNAEESARIELEQIRGLVRSVDGFILAASRLPDQELHDLAEGHHVVLIDRELSPIPSVTMDTGAGCRQILEHLSSLGHRAFVYCAGPPTSWMGAARWSALSQGAEEHDLAAGRIGPYTPTVAHGEVAADGALRTGASAFVAHNDLLAIGIMRRLHSRGVRVPQDVSVVGFDDIFAAEFVHPGLTTLGGPGDRAGRIAVELMLEGLGRRSSPSSTTATQIRLPTNLVLRDSSGVAPEGAPSRDA